MSGGAVTGSGVNPRSRKIAFEVNGRMFRFNINPNNYIDSRPHRTTAVKTATRLNVETFGDDVRSISIQGTTGDMNGLGAQKIKEMKEYMYDYANGTYSGNYGTEELILHNYINNESLIVHLSSEGIRFEQDATNPNLHNYSMNFLVLRSAGTPADTDKPETGNGDASLGNDELTGESAPPDISEVLNPQNPDSPTFDPAAREIETQIGFADMRRAAQES